MVLKKLGLGLLVASMISSGCVQSPVGTGGEGSEEGVKPKLLHKANISHNGIPQHFEIYGTGTYSENEGKNNKKLMIMLPGTGLSVGYLRPNGVNDLEQHVDVGYMDPLGTGLSRKQDTEGNFEPGSFSIESVTGGFMKVLDSVEAQGYTRIGVSGHSGSGFFLGSFSKAQENRNGVKVKTWVFDGSSTDFAFAQEYMPTVLEEFGAKEGKNDGDGSRTGRFVSGFLQKQDNTDQKIATTWTKILPLYQANWERAVTYSPEMGKLPCAAGAMPDTMAFNFGAAVGMNTGKGGLLAQMGATKAKIYGVFGEEDPFMKPKFAAEPLTYTIGLGGGEMKTITVNGAGHFIGLDKPKEKVKVYKGIANGM